MPVRLSTTINNIDKIQNSKNAETIREFYQFMKSTGASDKHINNNLKIIMSFSNHLDIKTDFKDVDRLHVMSYLDSKIKPIETDPEKNGLPPGTFT